MRLSARSGYFTIVILSAAPTLPAQQTPDANAVLAQAREALGGEKRLAGVKSLIATGRTRQVRGDNLVPIEFEIAWELPDKYVRKDEIPAQETGITSLGFNGDELIQLPPASPSSAASGSAPPANVVDAQRRARVATLKQDVARLMLGLFAGSSSAFPLTFTYVAQAEAPQGRAHVIEAKGPDNFAARLFVHTDTHLPIMVSWMTGGRGQAPPGRGGMTAPGPPGATPPSPAPPPTPPPAAAPPPSPPTGAQTPPGSPAAGIARGGAPAAPVENRLYFAEYREADGLQLPFRIRRAVGTDTVEETTFDRFRINAKIDPKKFEVRK